MHREIEYDLINKTGWEHISKEMERYYGIPPFHDLADPELLEEWEKIPAKMYMYFPNNMTPEQLVLLEGTGTLPVYDEGRTDVYPTYMAPRHVSQLQHNVPKPNRYDYISRWYTDRV